MKIKISIITACFNSEKTIEKTIQSVVNQNYSNIEYVLIDGGSTDGTMDIVNKYKNVFSVIVSEKDKGVADGFNKGILRATGDIIGILNADDIMYPGTAERLNREFDGIHDVYYGDHIVIDDENVSRCYKKAEDISMMDYHLPFSHQSVYITRKCYNKFGLYSLNYKLCLDYELIVKMYKGGATFKYVPYPFCEYRLGGCTYVDPVATVNEVTAIAVKYGLSKQKAFKYKMYYLSLCYGKRALTKIGLLKLARHIRQKFNKHVDYETTL